MQQNVPSLPVYASQCGCVLGQYQILAFTYSVNLPTYPSFRCLISYIGGYNSLFTTPYTYVLHSLPLCTLPFIPLNTWGLYISSSESKCWVDNIQSKSSRPARDTFGPHLLYRTGSSLESQWHGIPSDILPFWGTQGHHILLGFVFFDTGFCFFSCLKLPAYLWYPLFIQKQRPNGNS